MNGRFCFLAASCILSMLAAMPAAGQDEADEHAYGRGLVVERCTECHTLKRVFGAHHDREGWADAVARMEDQGLIAGAEETAAIVDFLVSQKERRPLLEQAGTGHFLVLHFPIVLLLLVAVFEGLTLWRGDGPISAHSQLLLRLAVLGTVVTAVLGLALVSEWRTVSPAVELHRNLGLATVVLAVLSLVLRQVATRTEKPWAVWAYRGALLLAVAAVTLTADRGGAMIHGDVVRDLVQALLGSG